MKKRLIPLAVLCGTGLALTSCGGGANVGPEMVDGVVQSPVIFWNRQPTDAENNVDTAVMTDSRFKDIYYVGFDANQGGQLQGQTVVDYLAAQEKANTDWWQHAIEDGKLTYGLIIGQIDHNDSATRTAGTRDALGTRGTVSSNPNTETPVAGKVTLNGNEYAVEEVAHQEAKSAGGVTWDAATATTIVDGWYADGGVTPDFIVSNNDGMAEAARGAVNARELDYLVPIFGYDSNASTLTYIKEDAEKTTGGAIVGTINQNAPAQAAGIFLAARNLLDGRDVMAGFNGNTIEGFGGIPEDAPFTLNKETHAILVDNFAITAENVADYEGKSASDLAYEFTDVGEDDQVSTIFIDLYSNSDTFLNSSMSPLFDAYKEAFGFEFQMVAGDGSADNSVLDKLLNKSAAYMVNPVKTTAASSYLNQIYNIEG